MPRSKKSQTKKDAIVRKPKSRSTRRARPDRALIMKPYSYTFKLAPNVLVMSTATVGSCAFSTLAGSSTFPLGGTGTFTPTMVQSATGFAGYHDVALACTFNLGDCTYGATFAGNYDAYRIKSVTMDMEWLCNTAPVNGAAILPTVYLYCDQDDAVLPANLLSLTSRQGVERIQLGDRMNTHIRRKIPLFTAPAIGAAAGGGGLTAGVNKRNQWINCAGNGPLAQHYGLKMWIADVNALGNPSVYNGFRFTFEYEVEFRAPLICS